MRISDWSSDVCSSDLYPTFTAARDAANSLSTRELPASYDIAAAGRLYRDHMQRIRVSDYPLVFWLERLIADGQRSVFAHGGHLGVSYYGCRTYIDYTPDLSWPLDRQSVGTGKSM